MESITLCPLHGKSFKWVEAGVSKKTGKPYQGFWSCPEIGCRMKPNEPTNMATSGFKPNNKPEATYVTSEKMSKEDWEAKEQRTNRNILLQVAFKAAVQMYCAGKIAPLQDTLFITAQDYYKWLLSQTEGQKPAMMANLAPSDPIIDEANEKFQEAREEISSEIAW